MGQNLFLWSGKTLLQITSQADACLANDSFAAHLAAAFGKPVVTVFGSGEPDWFAPFGNRQRVVATKACPHHPCIDRCVMPTYVCLESVTQTQVVSALQALLQEVQTNH
jgi:ADP-heptose:LPS heptosyltransferase